MVGDLAVPLPQGREPATGLVYYFIYINGRKKKNRKKMFKTTRDVFSVLLIMLLLLKYCFMCLQWNCFHFSWNLFRKNYDIYYIAHLNISRYSSFKHFKWYTTFVATMSPLLSFANSLWSSSSIAIAFTLLCRTKVWHWHQLDTFFTWHFLLLISHIYKRNTTFQWC